MRPTKGSGGPSKRDQSSRSEIFIIYASDVNSFNRLLNDFATNCQAKAPLYFPRSIQRIKDIEKVAFVKRVDLEIPEITVSLREIGSTVENVARLTNKDKNTSTRTIKIIFKDSQNRNSFVKTGLQLEAITSDIEEYSSSITDNVLQP